jgi:hypothetical protein
MTKTIKPLDDISAIGSEAPSRFNTSAYYILPLAQNGEQNHRGTREYGEFNFLNAYLSPDHSKIIIELKKEATNENLLFTFEANYTCQWEYNGNIYVELSIPEEFSEDVELILEGKFSSISIKAKNLIIESVNAIRLDRDITDEESKVFRIQVTKWPHLTAYLAQNMYVLPEMYMVLLGKDHPIYKVYKDYMEKKLDTGIPPDMDPLDKPILEEEIINLEIYNQKQEVCTT